MAHQDPTRCLILACGNPLRGDDGVGPWLAAWAEERFRGEPGVRVMARQQWGPELAEQIAHSESVLYLDSSLHVPPGSVDLVAVEPAATAAEWTHHLGAAELLTLSQRFYGSLPRCALLLTVGVDSMEWGESLSDAVRAAVPKACKSIEEVVLAQSVIQAADKQY